ncbi:hypothetical protein IZY60_10255 [Lutibacter sp. B2]|nr:hypothetical protein [Lutibacter sp. B2]
MNDLIPVTNQDLNDFLQELSIAGILPSNNKVLFLIAPVLFFVFLKNNSTNTFPRLNASVHNKEDDNSTTKENTLDKMSYLLENLKKANHLNTLRKNIISKNEGTGKINLSSIKEMLRVFNTNSNQSSNSQIQHISTILSVLDKVKDVKTVLAVKKALQPTEDGDISSQINNVIEVIGPMLPKEHADKVENFKKMFNMMKIMSAFDDSDDEESEEILDSKEENLDH